MMHVYILWVADSKSRSKSDTTSMEPIPAARPVPSYSIAAIDRALDLQETLARLGPVSLATLAKAAGCSRTAAFRILRTLQSRGYAVQDGARGQWCVGPRSGVLGRAAAAQPGLALLAQPFLEDIARQAREHAYLVQRQGAAAIITAMQLADQPIRRFVALNDAVPLYAGIGRKLLCHAPDYVQDAVLAGRLARLTPNTKRDPAAIRRDLAALRTRDWVVAEDDVIAGATGIAVPIIDADGTIAGLLAILSPTMRMRQSRARQLVLPLQQAATGLGQALAGS